MNGCNKEESVDDFAILCSVLAAIAIIYTVWDIHHRTNKRRNKHISSNL